ncbi:glutathione S-transferase-like [Ylistrum balloti]|uniref:glutathione S-transferase-like n=1 Tax=Ylistrum balloti TaxID=509963 RepID=UPI002905929E|nr:glutathione S-transferase-like [Ylistrum balloti]
MPTYKLTYFPSRARGELIRLIFTIVGQTYKNDIIAMADWPLFKRKMPTGQLPVLEVDGKQLSQSLAIARYLAREFDLAGHSSLEQCLVDQVVDTAADAFTEYYEYFKLQRKTKIKGKKVELQKTFVNETVPRFARIFNNFMESNGGENMYFVGTQMTIADLACYDIFTSFLLLNPNALQDFPKLKANRRKIEENERLNQYLAKRLKSSI